MEINGDVHWTFPSLRLCLLKALSFSPESPERPRSFYVDKDRAKNASSDVEVYELQSLQLLGTHCIQYRLSFNRLCSAQYAVHTLFENEILWILNIRLQLEKSGDVCAFPESGTQALFYWLLRLLFSFTSIPLAFIVPAIGCHVVAYDYNIVLHYGISRFH